MTHTSPQKAPVRIAVTGAAGQIAYSLLFRIAAGDTARIKRLEIDGAGPDDFARAFGNPPAPTLL